MDLVVRLELAAHASHCLLDVPPPITFQLLSISVAVAAVWLASHAPLEHLYRRELYSLPQDDNL